MKFIEKLKEKRKLKRELQECIDAVVNWDRVREELDERMSLVTDAEIAKQTNIQRNLVYKKIQENFDRIIEIQKQLKSL